MVSMSIWGPACWALFHTAIAKIKPEDFMKVRDGLMNNFRVISQNLPCPQCSNHAKMFFSRQGPLKFQTKDEMANFFWFFHNYVNTSKKKPQYRESDLSVYNNKNLREVYSNFTRQYTAKDNGLKMLSDTLHRKNILRGFHAWMLNNHRSFIV